MPTTVVAGREYNIVSHYRRRSTLVTTTPEDGGEPVQKVESKLVLVGCTLERIDKKDRKKSGRQRRKARKAEKRGKV